MQYIGYLCGNFTCNSNIIDFNAIDPRWQTITKTTEQRLVGQRLFQRDYYNFCYHQGDDLNSGIRRHIINIDQEIEINISTPNCARKCPIRIVSVECYQAPFSVVLFSIRVEITTSDIDDILNVMNRLRYTSRYANDPSTDPFREIALKPILDIYIQYGIYKSNSSDVNDRAMCRHLAEHNNKFRIFQVISLDENGWKNGDTDSVLFELGSMSHIGASHADDIFSPSPLFFRRTIDGGLIDIFSNWKGLALNDTFTMVGYEVSKEIREYQLECNFEMFYISQLFTKNYLIRLNNNFRKFLGDNDYKLSRSNANKLENRYNEFECKCWHQTVSYSTLPAEIYHSMGKAMDIKEEKDQLLSTILRQNSKREKQSDQRMNRLLFFMTCLTMSSAIWDACCLLNEMYPFGSHAGFRIVTSILLILICLIMYISRKR